MPAGILLPPFPALPTETPTGPAGGDLGGTFPDPTVDAIEGVPVSATAPTLGQVLEYNGAEWAPAGAAGGPVQSVTAGGASIAIGGTGANPTVALASPLLLPASPGHAITTGGGATLDDGSGNINIVGSTLRLGTLPYNAGVAPEENTWFGEKALNVGSATASESVAIGSFALMSATTGGANTAVGSNALRSLTTGSSNTAVGDGALYTAVTATGCTAVGNIALQFATGVSNTAVGDGALAALTTGVANTALGLSAGAAATTMNNAVMVGTSAGSTPNGVAGNASIAATGLTFVGYQTGSGNNADPTNLTAIGASAIGQTNGTIVGSAASGTGSNATAVGQAATAGLDSTAIGQIASANNTLGVAVGYDARANVVYGTALGALTNVTAAGGVAIGIDNAGTGASSAVVNQISIGTALHTSLFLGPIKASGGTNTAGSAAVTAPVLAAAAQLAQTSADAMLYIDVTVAGTLTIKIGPTVGVANTIVNGLAAAIGDQYTIRLPAGWYVAVTTSTTAVWTTTAITC